MNDPITQMAATSVAMRMLLAGDPLAKPADLLIAAASGLTQPVIELMMSHAAAKRTTFLALFRVDDGTPLLEKVMIVDGSTNEREINVLTGSFIKKPDGSFAILSNNRDAAYEYSFRSSGRRLVRRRADGGSDRASRQFSGMQALIAKAAQHECQEEAAGRSVYRAD